MTYLAGLQRAHRIEVNGEATYAAAARWTRSRDHRQQHRHAPVSWRHAVLSRKLRGHYGYYGITGNSVAITRFRYEVCSRRRKWLNRRGVQ